MPLPLLHALGIGLGWLVYGLDERYRKRLRANLTLALGPDAALRHRAIGESGKSLTELPAIWGRPYEDVLALVREVHGWQAVAALRGRGIVFMTPHLGCFEIASAYIASRLPMTVLYRPPKVAALAPVLQTARKRGRATLATTDFKGVKRLLKALKAQETVGILPDQVPSFGDGAWSTFFERPAYTMTLPIRLVKTTGAAAIMVAARRLPAGRGYALYFEPVALDANDPKAAITVLNQAVETIVRRFPEQYLWSYNRYKSPQAAPRLEV